MKKILFLILFSAIGFVSYSQSDNAGYLAVKDTLTNAEAVSQELALTGVKANVSFQVNVIKLTGTVAGTIKVFGSVDGTTYGTTAVTTTNLTDATANYLIAYTTNSYKSYRVTVETTGTSTASFRTYYLYRKP